MEDRPTNSKSSGKRSNPSPRLLAKCLVKIAGAFRVELAEQTVAIYAEFLSGYPDAVLIDATRRTIQEWTEPSKMPPLAFITHRADQVWREMRTQIPALPEAPPDDSTPEERKRYAKEIADRLRNVAVMPSGKVNDRIRMLQKQAADLKRRAEEL